MKLSETSIRRPVLATVLNLVILLIGIISYERLAVRLIPNVDVPIVTVATRYPGANAQVIESQMTKPIASYNIRRRRSKVEHSLRWNWEIIDKRFYDYC